MNSVVGRKVRARITWLLPSCIHLRSEGAYTVSVTIDVFPKRETSLPRCSSCSRLPNGNKKFKTRPWGNVGVETLTKGRLSGSRHLRTLKACYMIHGNEKSSINQIVIGKFLNGERFQFRPSFSVSFTKRIGCEMFPRKLVG